MLPIQQQLRSYGSAEKVLVFQRFFKTGPGQYGEGDEFIGVTVPLTRKAVQNHAVAMTYDEVIELLHSPVHEDRLAAVLVLVAKYQKADVGEKSKIYDLYLGNTEYINNWDLIDSSAEHIVGAFLTDKPKVILRTLAQSESVWERRISILSTFHWIKQGKAEETISIATLLLGDTHDLIHKAVGWMLREVGKRCSEQVLTDFLDTYAATMPRTMLRYAIERLGERERKRYMGMKKHSF